MNVDTQITPSSLENKFISTLEKDSGFLSDNQKKAVQSLATEVSNGYQQRKNQDKPKLFNVTGLSGTGKTHIIYTLKDQLEELGLNCIGDCTDQWELYDASKQDNWGVVRTTPVFVRPLSDEIQELNKMLADTYNEVLITIQSAAPDDLRKILKQNHLSIDDTELDRIVTKSLGSAELARLLLSSTLKFPGRENSDDLVIAGYLQQLCPPATYLPTMEEVVEDLHSLVHADYQIPDFTKLPIRAEGNAFTTVQDDVARLVELGLTFKDQSTWERYTRFAEASEVLRNKEPVIAVTAYLNNNEQMHGILNYFRDLTNFGFNPNAMGKAGLLCLEKDPNGKRAGYTVLTRTSWSKSKWLPDIRNFDKQITVASGADRIIQLAIGGHHVSHRHIVLPAALESYLQNQGILYHTFYPHNAQETSQTKRYSHILYDPKQESCQDLGSNPVPAAIKLT